MEVTEEAPLVRLPAPLKPYVDIRTGRSYATRDELDRARSVSGESTAALPAALLAAPGSSAERSLETHTSGMDENGDNGDVAASGSADDETGPSTPPDVGPAAFELAMSHRTIASGAVDEPFVCPRCFDFKCSFEPNLEAHLRQCRRRELPAHLEVIYPPSSLFPTPAQLRETQKRPVSNEGLSSLVKASRIVPNTVAVQTVFAAPPQQAAPVAPRRGRPPKEQSMIVPRGGKLTVTSPAGLVFSIRREARSKRFKCPRCITFSAGNPISFHEHIDHDCTAPWPTEVPSASEPSKPAGRGRGRRAAAALPAVSPAAAPLLNLPPPSPLPKRSPGLSEGLSTDEMSIDADGEADLAEMGISSAARPKREIKTQPAAGPSGSRPARESPFFPSTSTAGTSSAVFVQSKPSTAQPQPSAGPSSGDVNKRGVPRRSETLRIKPIATEEELSDDEDHPEYDAVMSDELDSDEEERMSRPRAIEPKRKKRASTAASDDDCKPGQHVLQEGELSSWQVTCRICDPALAFTNQSVKKVHHRVYHQTMCTIGAPEPGHTIKVYRTDKTFICPKCKVFANRDPVSLQTHAKNCKAVYSGPSDRPAPPALRFRRGLARRRAKPTPRLYAADQMTVDADGKPVALAPVEGAEGSATLASGPQAADEPTASKVWMCARCDPPLPLKSESDRAMHYRKTHQMETSITDPAGQVHLVRRSDDGFFRCLRCPGYTSRDSVLARTHIIKSCRFPWPVTPGQVDPNTVEVPAQSSSPRETKRRRKDPPGPSALGTPRNTAMPAAASTSKMAFASSSKAASASPAVQLTYGAVPSSELYTQPQASYGQQQQLSYAPLASSQDSHAGHAAAVPISYLSLPPLPPPPPPPPTSHASQHAADAYGAALALYAGPASQAAYPDPSSTYLAYAAAVGGDPRTQAVSTGSYAGSPASASQPAYAVAEQPAPQPIPTVPAARIQPLAPMATPEVLQALPSVERLAFVRLLEENENERAMQQSLPPQD